MVRNIGKVWDTEKRENKSSKEPLLFTPIDNSLTIPAKSMVVTKKNGICQNRW
jgi:hypothetical protein